MTREEIEREIAERLAAVLGEDATVPGNVGNWLAVAREVMVMMERVNMAHWRSTAEAIRSVHDGAHPGCRCPFYMPAMDLSPAVQDK